MTRVLQAPQPAVKAAIATLGRKSLRAGDRIPYMSPGYGGTGRGGRLVEARILKITLDTDYPLHLDTDELLIPTWEIRKEEEPLDQRQWRSIRSFDLNEGMIDARTRREKFADDVRNLPSTILATSNELISTQVSDGCTADFSRVESVNTSVSGVTQCIDLREIHPLRDVSVESDVDVGDFAREFTNMEGVQGHPHGIAHFSGDMAAPIRAVQKRNTSAPKTQECVENTVSTVSKPQESHGFPAPPVQFFSSPEEAKDQMNLFARDHGYAL